jgi:hypothetical protein
MAACRSRGSRLGRPGVRDVSADAFQAPLPLCRSNGRGRERCAHLRQRKRKVTRSPSNRRRRVLCDRAIYQARLLALDDGGAYAGGAETMAAKSADADNRAGYGSHAKNK